MYATIQKWGDSQGIRIPKSLLEALGIRENDRVELKDTISIKKAAAAPHKTLNRPHAALAFSGEMLYTMETHFYRAA